MRKRLIAAVLSVIMAITSVNCVFATENNDYTAVSTSDQIQMKPVDTDLSGSIDGNLIQLEATAIDTSLYTSSEQDAAVSMREQIKLHQNVVTSYIKTKSADIYGTFERIWDAAFAETANPAEGDYLFWQMENMAASYNAVIKKENGVAWYYVTYTVKINYYITLQQEQELTQKIEEINNSFKFTETTTEYDKVKTIYDYICSHVAYDYGSSNIKFSAYAAIINGKSVCQGYATLFYRLAKMQGISSQVIAGYGTNTSVYHGWNIVKIGNFYYNLDATWDAVNYSKGQSYEYFLKGDVFPDHTRNSEYITAEFYAAYPMAANDYSASGVAVASAGTVNAKIKIKKPVIKKLTRTKIKISKIANVTGYEIQYSTSEKFTKNKKTTTTKRIYKLKKISKKKTYYFRVRGYRDAGIGRIYTKWSKTKKIKKSK